ncbi:hypothetical protein EsH8_IV_000557 [Colletotrichum jinshuiense]
MDKLIARYSAGYVEILGSVAVQVVYLAFGLLVEWLRPAYTSSTSPKILAQSIRNHVVVTLAHAAFVVSRGGASVLTRTYIPPYSLPSWTEFAGQMLVGILMRDAIFYVVHRLWHIRGLYELVHAKHHEITYPGNHHVWTISYMSVVDFFSLYGLPVVAVAKALEMNVITALGFALFSAVGEQIKLVWGDEAHDEHHVNMGVNYGAYGVMDAICGTTSGTSVAQTNDKEE